MSTPEIPMHRRTFVTTCACALATAALGGCASMATRLVPASGGRVTLRVADYPELSREGGAIKILPDGMTDPLYVLALGGGTYSVLSPRCTHRGCTVGVQGARLVCPCHGSTYDREGTVLKGPAERPLTRFPVSVANGVVEIRLAEAQ